MTEPLLQARKFDALLIEDVMHEAIQGELKNNWYAHVAIMIHAAPIMVPDARDVLRHLGSMGVAYEVRHDPHGALERLQVFYQVPGIKEQQRVVFLIVSTKEIVERKYQGMEFAMAFRHEPKPPAGKVGVSRYKLATKMLARRVRRKVIADPPHLS